MLCCFMILKFRQMYHELMPHVYLFAFGNLIARLSGRFFEGIALPCCLLRRCTSLHMPGDNASTLGSDWELICAFWAETWISEALVV